TEIPCQTPICRATALRKFFAPHVIAYWFTSPSMAARAASLILAGAAKSGNPCARFTAPYNIACRVISRITDSVNCETLSLRNCFGCVDKEEITSAIAGRLAQEGMRDC